MDRLNRFPNCWMREARVERRFSWIIHGYEKRPSCHLERSARPVFATHFSCGIAGGRARSRKICGLVYSGKMTRAGPQIPRLGPRSASCQQQTGGSFGAAPLRMTMQPVVADSGTPVALRQDPIPRRRDRKEKEETRRFFLLNMQEYLPRVRKHATITFAEPRTAKDPRYSV